MLELEHRPARRGAFTILEVLVTVALLGLVGALFISGTTDLLRAREPRPEDAFWSTLGAARQLALETGREVTLTFDSEKKLFTWTDGRATQTRAFPGLAAEFLRPESEGRILLGGVLAETSTLKSVRFYADGTCDAFRAQLQLAPSRRVVLQVDPWTCAPILPKP